MAELIFPESTRRTEAIAIFDAAIAAVTPARFLPPVLPEPPASGRLIVLAAGKAAGAMAAAAERHYLDRPGFEASRLCGMAIARHGYGQPLHILRGFEAGHPIPDEAGIAATQALMALAETARAEDLVLFLLSGGASANLIAPAAGISLAEKQIFTRQVLRAGVPIDGINTIRKHISAVKGGRLMRLIAPAACITIALSDVPGDDLSAIGSGPTIPDRTTLAEARAILDHYGVVPPASIAATLADPASETPKPDDPIFAAASALVAARPADAFAAARSAAAAQGYAVIDLGAELQGEAREIAMAHAEIARARQGSGQRLCLISGGELTVTLHGNGRGGPNQEYALALALALDGAPGISAFAGDTDGTDGGVGDPADPAGAFIDPETLARAGRLGLDAAAMLSNNDSTTFFNALGDLHAPGPTLTNANDLRIILIDG